MVEYNAFDGIGARLEKRLKHEYYCAIDTIYITYHVTLHSVAVCTQFCRLLLFSVSVFVFFLLSFGLSVFQSTAKKRQLKTYVLFIAFAGLTHRKVLTTNVFRIVCVAAVLKR